jgi:hypothetical protein
MFKVDKQKDKTIILKKIKGDNLKIHVEVFSLKKGILKSEYKLIGKLRKKSIQIIEVLHNE